MSQQPNSDLQAELDALRQKLGNLEAKHGDSLRSASRSRRAGFSRKFLLGALSLAALLTAGGLLYGQGAGDALFIDPNGNVGIGTTNPDNRLTITATQQAQETDITQNVTNNGLNIEADYVPENRLPGIVWSTNNNNPTKPKAGIWISEHNTGSRLYVGTSNNYATGITNTAITVKEDGNVGIGTKGGPGAKLDVQSAARTGSHPTSVNGLYVTGDFGPDNNGVEFRHSNASQGIGFGYNTLYATGSDANQDLNLKPKGTGKVNLRGNLVVDGNVKMNSLQIGDTLITESELQGFLKWAGTLADLQRAVDRITKK